jgi:Transposase IS66 family
MPTPRKRWDYMLKRWDAFTRFLDDGRICLTNNAAQRELPALPWGVRRGCSPGPIVAESALPPCTP